MCLSLTKLGLTKFLLTLFKVWLRWFGVVELPLELKFVVHFGHSLAVFIHEFLSRHVGCVFFHLYHPVIYFTHLVYLPFVRSFQRLLLCDRFVHISCRDHST